ncbi:chlorohydrolase family protein [Sinomonas sp. ASV322]|uniref:chlorohydrolase family protein n=1 Tax=Sinomonas sp. ASV322 TaxID=3041920 RepID=UPI0027DD3DBE|nr:chlorohydrolase family protein [Sinomonas sp. ASV322]MDQ4504002.1 chlorohydrolase family protein [Sinomonas sp. ASV322]
MKSSVSARYLLAHRDGRHIVVDHGTVVHEDGVVVYAGPTAGAPAAESHRDLGDALIMPGLIDLDALSDIDHLILDSWAGGELSRGHLWSEDYFRTRRADVFTPEERQDIRHYALIQLALHGVTSFMPIASEIHSSWAESFDELTGMAETSRQIGLRAFLGPAYRSGVNVALDDGTVGVLFDEDLGREGLKDAVRFLDFAEQLGDPLVSGVLLPCRIETLTRELLDETARISRERDVLVRLHSLQGLSERALVIERHGMTPLELLDDAGLLGERLLIPHALFLDRNSRVHGEDRGDLARLAASGASMVHCPLTSMRYGEALESFPAYVEAGVSIALGTDSFPPDLIRGIDVGWHLAKIVERQRDAVRLSDYVDAATLGGARALRRPDLGRLSPGAQADFVAFGLGDLRDGVHEDPVRTLVLNGTARQCVLSVVAGRTVVEDGGLPGEDLSWWRRRGQELFDKMRSAYSERDERRRGVDELFPPVYGRDA